MMSPHQTSQSHRSQYPTNHIEAESHSQGRDQKFYPTNIASIASFYFYDGLGQFSLFGKGYLKVSFVLAYRIDVNPVVWLLASILIMLNVSGVFMVHTIRRSTTAGTTASTQVIDDGSEECENVAAALPERESGNGDGTEKAPEKCEDDPPGEEALAEDIARAVHWNWPEDGQ